MTEEAKCRHFEEKSGYGDGKKQKTSILFLGTGAADWPLKIPPEFSKLPCKDWRRLCSALVDGHILIDCGPCVLAALDCLGIGYETVTDILLTHTHDDHFSIEALKALTAKRSGEDGIRLWGHSWALERIPSIEGCVAKPLEVGTEFQIGDIRVKALEANHLVEDSREKPLYYHFIRGDKQWLYATDGGWLLLPTWRYLLETRLDLVVLDATVGEVPGDYRIFEHNNLAMVDLMVQTFRKQQVLKKDGTVILTHMARTLHEPHRQLEAKLQRKGLLAAYDGLCVEV